jgi:ABC-type branched-subunit amino acid transport system substrate-binding protein
VQARFGLRLGAVCATVACAVALAACGSSGDDNSSGSASTSGGAATSSSGGGGSTSTAANKSPINFALVSFKIPAQDFIGRYLEGAEAAAKIINSQGGFGGHPVTITTCNDQLSTAPTLECAHKTLSKHPVAMFGCSVAWDVSGLQLYDRQGVPSFNCASTVQGYKDPLNFGLGSSTWGEMGGMLRWLCANRPDVKRVGYAEQVDPEDERTVPPILNAIAKPCGIKITYNWVNQTAPDLTPVVSKMLDSDPQFLLTVVSGEQMVTVAKLLQQNNFSTSNLAINSSAASMNDDFKPAGDALKGVWITDEWKGWGIQGDPEVAAYQKALANDPNRDSGNVEQGYMYMMYMYNAAKKIGFDKFNSKTLADFSNSANGFSSPMLHGIVNPGPSWNTQMKNPWIQLLHWDGTKMVPETKGTDDGWINTLTGKP